MERIRTLILGAAGRDFHNFNVVYELQEIGRPDLSDALSPLLVGRGHASVPR